MNKIESFEQYRELVGAAKKNGFKLSNCFFLPTVVRQMIEQETLFYQDTADGLLLFNDCVGFYRCYFYFSENAAPNQLELDKDSVIEFPYNGEINENQALQVEKINAMGFSLGRESSMMSADADEILHTDKNESAICKPAQAKDVEGILALLEDNFNPLFSFIPSYEELLSATKEEQVFVIRDVDRIAAALVSGFEKRAACVNQIAVDDSYRRRGYGRALMQSYHEKYKGKADVFRHWVDISNSSAIAMYKSFGYGFSLRKANEYIKIVKGENKK